MRGLSLFSGKTRMKSICWVEISLQGKRKAEADYEEVSEYDPPAVLLTEDELQDEPNNGELKEHPEDGVDNLLLKPNPLIIR